MTTDNTQELDEILDRIEELSLLVAAENSVTGSNVYVSPSAAVNKVKQAILDWHNKQVEEIIKKPHTLPKNAQHQESVKQGINFYHRQMRKRVDKLKESSNDKDS